MDKVTLLFPVPRDVVLGKFIGCWITWTNIFKPDRDWRKASIPKYNVKETIENSLRGSPHRVFGCDVILRSIAVSVGSNANVMQATKDFVITNDNWISLTQAPGLQANVNALCLTEEAIRSWDELTREKRLEYCEYGQERLRYVINIIKEMDVGFNVNDVFLP